MNNKSPIRCCWREDLEASRNLTPQQKNGFTMLLGWFENFRLRKTLSPGREAAVLFWRTEVLHDGKEREQWQLDQWAEAMAWYLNWFRACQHKGGDHRSIPERMRDASDTFGMRRGLARRTRLSYGSWIARYGAFAKTANAAMDPAVASEFLGWIVKEQQCSYATQKIALNSLAFFFKGTSDNLIPRKWSPISSTLCWFET